MYTGKKVFLDFGEYVLSNKFYVRLVIKTNLILFFKGVGPTAQRAAVITAVELPIYDICKHRLIQENLLEDTVFNHFV